MAGGKTIALIACQERHDIWAFDFDKLLPENMVASDFSALICIPTTADSGAETESTAMIIVVVRNIKGCVWHPLARPSAVILDPELTPSVYRLI